MGFDVFFRWQATKGMRVTEECWRSFMAMKWKRVHRYVVYKIDERSGSVMVDKVGGPGEDMKSLLPPFLTTTAAMLSSTSTSSSTNARRARSSSFHGLLSLSLSLWLFRLGGFFLVLFEEKSEDDDECLGITGFRNMRNLKT